MSDSQSNFVVREGQAEGRGRFLNHRGEWVDAPDGCERTYMNAVQCCFYRDAHVEQATPRIT